MPTPHSTPRRASPAGVAARCRAGLAAASATAGLLVAQQPQASYPLLVDLDDATQINGPMVLYGTTPPAPPANGLCLNGVYLFSGSSLGQDARTPNIGSLDTNDFQVEVEFQIAALPGFNSPILVGGNGWRWIGLVVQPNGTLGILHNNAMLEWSTTSVNLATWYSAVIKYEGGMVELLLNGTVIHQANIGPLNTGNNLNFTPTNYSNGTAFNGCLRNLVIANDTTLGTSGGSIGTNYCTANPNSTGATGVITGRGSAVVSANAVTLEASQLPNNAFGYFITSLTPANIPNPGGSQGVLCVTGAIGRYTGPGQIRNSGATGMFSLAIDLTQIPTPTGFVSAVVGQTRNFQAWHRDSVGGTAVSNFTNGLALTFL